MINHTATVVEFYGRSHLTINMCLYTMYKEHSRHTHAHAGVLTSGHEKVQKSALCAQRAKQDVNIALFEMITREN